MIFNSKIWLNPSLWNFEGIFGPTDKSGGSIETLTLQILAKLPRYIQDSEAYLFEMKLVYRQIMKEMPRLCRHVAKIRETTLSIHVPVMRLYASCLLLALAILLNDILRAFDPYDDLLVDESAFFVSELMVLAEEVTLAIPLGAAYMPVCLIAVWATTEDASTQARVEDLLIEYQAAALDRSRWFDTATWTKNRLRRLRFKGTLDDDEQIAESLMYSY